MQIADGDLFTTDCNAICIPTNGFVTGINTLVMGAGVARQAVDRWPVLPDILGQLVYKLGNAVHLATNNGPNYPADRDAYLGALDMPYHIVSFPTKPTKVLCTEIDKVLPRFRAEAEQLQKSSTDRNIKWLPGWKAKSDLLLIKHSCEELMELADKMKWKKVCLPRVGCGAGELEWTTIATLLREHLDQRFVVLNRK
jgi:hypothetical protein